MLRAFVEAFTPLRNRNFSIYLGGQAISLIGTWLQMTAQGWVVWELTHSSAALGIVATLGTLPILLVGPWAGAWADRLDRRKLLIGTQAAAMVVAFALALLLQTNTIQIWQVYVLSAVLGIATALDMPAQQAFLGDLTGMAQVRKAVNLNAMIVQGSRMIGPALAGFIIGALGSATAFWLNGLSFVAVIISLWVVRANQARAPHSGNPWRDFIDALRHVRQQPRIQDLLSFVVLITFFALPVINILPAVVSTVLNGNAETLGLILASSGAGALFGTLFVVPITQSLKRTGLVLATAAFWMGICVTVFSFSRWVPLSVAAMFLWSVAAPVIFTMALGLIQVLAPQGMRARLLSLMTMVAFGLQPVASLLIGYSAQILGAPTAIQINGLLLMGGSTLLLLLRSDLRRWEVGAQLGPATS